MNSSITQPSAVIFLRARCLGPDGGDREVEQQLIAAQRAACEQEATARGLHIIREYIEYGGTGSIGKRPVLRLMLDELLALHDADYVIVTNTDRLARKTDDMAAISLELEAGGAELVVAGNQPYVQYQAVAPGGQITVKTGS